MALRTITNIVTYIANGSTSVFAFPFMIQIANDLMVILNDNVINTGFSISPDSFYREYGEIIFDYPPENGVIITLILDPENNRLVKYQQNGELAPKT